VRVFLQFTEGVVHT